MSSADLARRVATLTAAGKALRADVSNLRQRMQAVRLSGSSSEEVSNIVANVAGIAAAASAQARMGEEIAAEFDALPDGAPMAAELRRALGEMRTEASTVLDVVAMAQQPPM